MEVQLLIFGIWTIFGIANGDARPLNPESTLASMKDSLHHFPYIRLARFYFKTHGESKEGVLNRSVKIGSRPPSCRNKCNGFRPCAPVELSVPPTDTRKGESYKKTARRDVEDNSPYYNLAWGCRCNGKYYHP